MVNHFPSKNTLRKSGILFSSTFLIIFGVIPYLIKGELKQFVPFISLGVFILSLANPYSLRIPYVYWIKFGEILSKVNSKLILGIFFYLVITPGALLRRIVKVCLLQKEKDDSSYIKIETKNASTFRDEF
tara:strand:+ start:127 stop:516 length:390 start_codon:yes stop_codon:yes gene_type:complete